MTEKTLSPSMEWCQFCTVPPAIEGYEPTTAEVQTMDPEDLDPEQMSLNAKYAISTTGSGKRIEALVEAPGVLNIELARAMNLNQVPERLKFALSHCMSCQLAGVCSVKPPREEVDVIVTNGML
jgi:hypothetical protein